MIYQAETGLSSITGAESELFEVGVSVCDIAGDDCISEYPASSLWEIKDVKSRSHYFMVQWIG